MKRLSVAAIAILVSTAAFAHPGHIAAEAGHSHWLAVGCAVAAIAIGAMGFVLNRRAAARRAR